LRDEDEDIKKTNRKQKNKMSFFSYKKERQLDASSPSSSSSIRSMQPEGLQECDRTSASVSLPSAAMAQKRLDWLLFHEK